MVQACSTGWCIAIASLLIFGCSASPVGPRARVVELPLAAAQSNIEFALRTDIRAELPCLRARSCPPPPYAAVPQGFAAQLERIGGALSVGARARYPTLTARLPNRTDGPFAMVMVAGDGVISTSSADGRIGVGVALAGDAPEDGVVAFILAREMSHVLARHHAENASTGFFVSAALNAVLPGSGIVKALVAAGGARLAAARNAPVQAVEADVMAAELLEASGYRLNDVAASLKRFRVRDDGSAWSTRFRESTAAMIARVARPDGSPAALAIGAIGDTMRPATSGLTAAAAN